MVKVQDRQTNLLKDSLFVCSTYNLLYKIQKEIMNIKGSQSLKRYNRTDPSDTFVSESKNALPP